MDILKKIPRPGLRTIKTGVAIFITLILYNLIGIPDRVTFALFAILICMQDTVEKTVREGVDRVAGTVIGAVFAIVMIHFGIFELSFFWYATAMAVGLIILIHLCYMLKLTSTIIMAYFTFFGILLATGDDAVVQSALYRTLDTIVGIGLAYAVNVMMYRPKTIPQKKISIVVEHGDKDEEPLHLYINSYVTMEDSNTIIYKVNPDQFRYLSTKEFESVDK